MSEITTKKIRAMCKEQKVSREAKKKEAVRRMRMLQIYPQTRLQFERKNLVSVSEPPFGACFWLSDEQKERVREFEEHYNALVYFGIVSVTTDGILENYLYVSDDEEEWSLDREDILGGETMVWCYNAFDPQSSELGRIAIKRTIAAGLKRVF